MSTKRNKLVDLLFEIGAIKFGAFKLKLHETNPEAPLSPFYIDLRILRSFPKTKKVVVDNYLKLLRKLKFDLVADVPTAATPLVASISDRLQVPMVTPRTDKKTHGTGAPIDGVFKKGQRAVLVDDLVTRADSKLEAAKILANGGLKVRDVVVLVDREQGGGEELAAAGYKLHSLFGIRDLFQYYADVGKISKTKYQEILDYLG